MKTGLVYLAGAGPGDPGLITVAAMWALAEADCVIYDFLASPQLLDGLSCELIYVGKQGADHTLAQEEINALMVRKAREGKTVVRLKGGDPFIFGRGGEEAEELIANGIPFRVIPGVSSFYAAPAYAGIPVTHREFANAFEVITGHRRADAAEDEEVNFPDFNPHKTYAFLMGMKNLGRIASALIDEKKFPAHTPAAVISWGGTPDQRVAVGELASIAHVAGSEGIGAPAVIVVGEVVRLRERLRWFDTLPLFGRSIVVTRTREQASRLAVKLSHLGARVIEFPTIELRARGDLSELRGAMDSLHDYDWIVFTSQNGVRIFFGELFGSGRDARHLHGRRIAAIGPATAAEIKKYSITPDLVPPRYVAEGLLDEFRKAGMRGSRVLLPCASEARETLKEGLVSLGALVHRIHVYDTLPPPPPASEAIEALKGADIVSFTSSSTVRNFFSLVSDTGAIFASIGPVTSAEVRKHGREVAIEASEYTIEGLVEAIVRYYRPT